jgi:hypothetical protein
MSVNDASRILIDDSTVMLQIVASLTGDSRGIIYDCNMAIVQATGANGGIGILNLRIISPAFYHCVTG